MTAPTQSRLRSAALAAAFCSAVGGCGGEGGLVAEVDTPLADVTLTRTPAAGTDPAAAGEAAEAAPASGSASEQLVLTPNYGVIVQAGGNVHVYPLPGAGDVRIPAPPGETDLETAGGGGDAGTETADPGDNAIARARPPAPREPFGPPEPVEEMGPPEPAAAAASAEAQTSASAWTLYSPLLDEDYVADLEAEHSISAQEMAEIDAQIEQCRTALRSGWTVNPWCAPPPDAQRAP